MRASSSRGRMFTHDADGHPLPRPVPMHLSPGGSGPRDLGPFGTFCGRDTDDVHSWATPELGASAFADYAKCRSCVAALAAQTNDNVTGDQS